MVEPEIVKVSVVVDAVAVIVVMVVGPESETVVVWVVVRAGRVVVQGAFHPPAVGVAGADPIREEQRAEALRTPKIP